MCFGFAVMFGFFSCALYRGCASLTRAHKKESLFVVVLNYTTSTYLPLSQPLLKPTKNPNIQKYMVTRNNQSACGILFYEDRLF